MSFGSLPSVLGNGGGVAISVIGGTGLFADGTAAAPSISFASQTNKGFYNNASNQIGVAIAGVYSMAFAASGQLVGVHGGNTLQLDGNGACKLTASGTNQNITLTPSGTGIVGIDSSVSVRNTQNINFAYPADTTVATGKIGWWSGANVGVWVNQSAANVLDFATNGGTALQILASRRALLGTATDSGALLQVGANAATGYATAGMSFGGDTFLSRRAAGELEILSGVGAEALLSLNQNGTQRGYIRSNGGGVEFRSTTANPLILSTNNLTALTLDASQNATFAGSVTAAAAANFTFSGRSYISSPADGVIRLLNNAGTDFARLQFGGTTASFPALARSGTNLLVVDATGGSYTPILASNFWATGSAVTVSAGNVSYGGSTSTTVGAAGSASPLPALPAGYIIINVAGTPAKLPYYLA